MDKVLRDHLAPVRITVNPHPIGLNKVERGYRPEFYEQIPWYVQNKDMINGWRENPQGALWLWSNQAGTGKTGFATCCAKSTPGQSLIIRVPSLSFVDTDTFSDLIRTARTSKLIVLDDWHRLDWAKVHRASMMFVLMDAIYGEGIPMIVTSNKEFTQALDLANQVNTDVEAIFDRVSSWGLLQVNAADVVRGLV